MFSTRDTNKTTRIPQLDTRFDFYRWFRALKNHVRADLWTYFDPDSNRVYEEPEPPKCSSVKKGAIGIEDFDTSELKLWLEFQILYDRQLERYQRYLEERTTLTRLIWASVPNYRIPAPVKEEQDTPRWILQKLQCSMKPDEFEMDVHMSETYYDFIDTKHSEWPDGGPKKWLEEWLGIIEDCRMWSKFAVDRWHTDFISIWRDVPDAQKLCSQISHDFTSGDSRRWTPTRAEQYLLETWERSKKKMSTKDSSHDLDVGDDQLQKIAKNGEGEDALNQSTSPTINPPRKRSNSASDQNQPSPKRLNINPLSLRPCRVCGLMSHTGEDCVLVIGSNPRGFRISSKSKSNYNRQMQDPNFASWVENYRRTLRS